LCPCVKNSNVECDESTSTDLLGKLGLTKNQARLYGILLREGPVTISELAKRSGIHRANAYRIVSQLKNIGLIELLLGTVTRVRALRAGEALDILIARQEEQLDRIRSVKSRTRLEPSEQLVNDGMRSVRSGQIFARLLIGRHVYSQQERLIQESKEEIVQVTSTKGFLLARNIGLIDSMATKAKKDGVKVRILTETIPRLASVRREIPTELEIRHCSNTLTMLRYFIADRKHLILKMAAPPRVQDQSVALWSNSLDLIQGLYYEFERLWVMSSGV
jgi:sugar-specific transcriptional regulator TrmB